MKFITNNKGGYWSVSDEELDSWLKSGWVLIEDVQEEQKPKARRASKKRSEEE